MVAIIIWFMIAGQNGTRKSAARNVVSTAVKVTAHLDEWWDDFADFADFANFADFADVAGFLLHLAAGCL